MVIFSLILKDERIGTFYDDSVYYWLELSCEITQVGIFKEWILQATRLYGACTLMILESFVMGELNDEWFK